MMKVCQSLKMWVVWVALMAFLLCHCDALKECTNIPTQLGSHTLRYELSLSHNETLKKEMFSHYHLTPTDDAAWSNLLTRRLLKEENEFNWEMMYRQMKNKDGVQVPGGLLKEVPLGDVRLEPNSFHGRAQATNLKYLLMLDVDNLLWSFRQTAGLPTPGKPYLGWEKSDCELRGHFVGHYLSATAKMWASTGDAAIKEKMNALVSGLAACQDKMGTGYLSAFPSELFDRYEAIKPVWAPYYTIHKILAGLLDQYTFGGNAQALKMVTRMVEYFYNRVQNVIKLHTVERHYQSLNTETGGMNDVLYRLYGITGNTTHLLLAHLFDKPCFLGILAVQAESLSGLHANTHIPIVVGGQLRYELTGDPLYKEMSTFFMDSINSSHSYATGGTSAHEFWTDPKRLADTLGAENEESCTTYNMLKVSRNLFRWTKGVAYADYYERALTNGVLSIQRGTDPGVMIYMLPLGSGSSKARSYHGWGTPFETFWCCYGTGIESFSKLGDSIYFEEGAQTPTLYVIQYISSSLNWKSGNVLLNQVVDPVHSDDPNLRMTMTFSPKESVQSSTINLRIPSWTSASGAQVLLNGQSVGKITNGIFQPVTNKWSSKDKLSIVLPINLRTEAIGDDRTQFASTKAILFGPYLLAGHSGGDKDIKTGTTGSFSDWITPVPSSYNTFLVTLSQMSGNASFALTNSNQTITMEMYPGQGTDSAVHATFRLVLNDTTANVKTLQDVIGKRVKLEPFDFPGMVLATQGPDQKLVIAGSNSVGLSSDFFVIQGLDGKNGTISLKSANNEDCFVYSGVNYKSGVQLKLSCKPKSSSDVAFDQASSFAMQTGVSQYHPISFVAKGPTRNFLMAPLMSFMDETYTVYFNIIT
ncbi:uncharacterized protein LOC111459415 [Cucurbita moschata]|uniref:Uncharacterized protein LOC111459415 n=1 Tax=Cucurbita moschata TaxID=3662 RepID=A0A6J1H2F6_CUCMO|nr:uncharacterized protein LOC111459415 [Cucurbita moschata]